MQVRLVERLLNPQVSRAGHVSNFLQQLARPGPVAFQVVADHLDVDGSGQSEVQNLRDHVGRQKSEHYPGKLLGQSSGEVG